jgi:hypothetical protein
MEAKRIFDAILRPQVTSMSYISNSPPASAVSIRLLGHRGLTSRANGTAEMAAKPISSLFVIP